MKPKKTQVESAKASLVSLLNAVWKVDTKKYTAYVELWSPGWWGIRVAELGVVAIDNSGGSAIMCYDLGADPGRTSPADWILAAEVYVLAWLKANNKKLAGKILPASEAPRVLREDFEAAEYRIRDLALQDNKSS